MWQSWDSGRQIACCSESSTFTQLSTVCVCHSTSNTRVWPTYRSTVEMKESILPSFLREQNPWGRLVCNLIPLFMSDLVFHTTILVKYTSISRYSSGAVSFWNNSNWFYGNYMKSILFYNTNLPNLLMSFSSRSLWTRYWNRRILVFWLLRPFYNLEFLRLPPSLPLTDFNQIRLKVHRKSPTSWQRVAKLKWYWVGYVTRQNLNICRRTPRSIHCTPWARKKRVSRPKKRRFDDIRIIAEIKWYKQISKQIELSRKRKWIRSRKQNKKEWKNLHKAKDISWIHNTNT